MYYAWFDAPITRILLAGDDDGLRYLVFDSGRHVQEHGGPRPDWVESSERLASVIEQLDAYFDGELTEFDLKLAPAGTDFQQRVWTALRTIPFGETVSYGEIARSIGQPTASRAVGLANGRNPISIIVPCHRVIGSSGRLVGYGGGIDNKRWLLDHEQGVIETQSGRAAGFRADARLT